MRNLFDTTVILRKKVNEKETRNQKLRNGDYIIKKKKILDSSYKLDEDTGNYKSPEINKQISYLIRQQRNNKKLSQKVLAQKLNIQVNLLNNYESGKIKPDNNILGKLEKYLGIRLRGNKEKLGTKI